MNLGLKRSSGYVGSWLVDRAGFLDVKQAKREGWMVPKDRKAAENAKQELKERMEEKKKEKQASEQKKKKAKQKTKDPV